VPLLGPTPRTNIDLPSHRLFARERKPRGCLAAFKQRLRAIAVSKDVPGVQSLFSLTLA
jgi:hypothetical protein